MRSSRILRTIAAILGGVVLGLLVIVGGIALVLYVKGWDILRPVVERQASNALGREVKIAGPLGVDLTWAQATIHLPGITVANADWSKDPNLASVDRLDFAIRYWQLLRGRIDLPTVAVASPHVLVERNEQGQSNLPGGGAPKTESSGPANLPAIGRVEITDAQFTYRQPHASPTELKVPSLVGQDEPEQQRFSLNGNGSYLGQAFSLQALTGSLSTLQDKVNPIPLKLDMKAGSTQVHLDGRLTDPASLESIDAELDLKGNNVGELFPLFGFAAPDTPPYKLSGRLNFQNQVWLYKGMKGTIGDSDIAGSVEFRNRQEKPYIKADLASRVLDFNDLGLIVGAPSGTGKGETASPEEKKFAQQYAARPRVLPDASLDFARVRGINADVNFKGEKVEAPGVPLSDVAMDFSLKDSVMTFKPLAVNVSGGKLVAYVTIDASKDLVATDYDLRLSGFKLEQIAKGMAAGTVTARVKLHGDGNSVAKSLGTSNGNVVVLMHGGRLSHVIIEAMGLDIAETLGFLVEGDKPTPIRCSVISFDVHDGLMQSKGSFLDTVDSLVTIDGTTSLKDEVFKMDVEAHAKDFSPLAAQAPIHVTGTFKNVSIMPDIANLALRTGGAVALGVFLTPLASVLTFLDVGGADDADCSQAMQKANQEPAAPVSAKTKPSPSQKPPIEKVSPAPRQANPK